MSLDTAVPSRAAPRAVVYPMISPARWFCAACATVALVLCGGTTSYAADVVDLRDPTSDAYHDDPARFYVPAYFSKTELQRTLNLDKDILVLGWGGGLKIADSFYDDKRVRRNASLRFYEASTAFHLHYGVHKDLSFGFSLPLRFTYMQNNTRSSSLDDSKGFGLGDARFFAYYRLAEIPEPLTALHLFAAMKMPSANTDIGSVEEPRLPLGNGQHEYQFGTAVKFVPFADVFGIQIKGSYTLRKQAVAEYLQVQSPVLPGVALGNRSIDFGDSWDLWLINQFQLLDSLEIELGAHHQTRMSTTIDGKKIDSAKVLAIKGSKGYLLEGDTAINLRLGKYYTLRMRNSMPLAGSIYPLVDLAVVDGLLGMLNSEVCFDVAFD